MPYTRTLLPANPSAMLTVGDLINALQPYLVDVSTGGQQAGATPGFHKVVAHTADGATVATASTGDWSRALDAGYRMVRNRQVDGATPITLLAFYRAGVTA